MTTTTQSSIRSFQPLFDRLAIVASLLCAIHCVILPIFLVSFPTLLSLPVDDHHFHQILVWFVVPFSVAGALLGYFKHKNTTVLIGAVVGIAMVIGAAVFGHDFLGEIGEKIATVLGSIILIAAHYKNFTTCRNGSC